MVCNGCPRLFTLLLLATASACRSNIPDVCAEAPGETCLAVVLFAEDPNLRIDQVHLTASAGPKLDALTPPTAGTATPLPVAIAVRLGRFNGNLTIDADGLLRGQKVGSAEGSLTIAAGEHRRLDLTLRAPTPPGLAVTRVTPSIGPTAGGTSIVIEGSEFVEGVRVMIDGKPATSVQFVDASHLRAATPANPGHLGPVDVVVTSPKQNTAKCTGCFAYFTNQLEFERLPSTPMGVGVFAVGDFNGDGKPDILSGTPNMQELGVRLLQGNGDGTFQTPKSPYGNCSSRGPKIVADVDGDGQLDALSTADSILCWGSNNGNQFDEVRIWGRTRDVVVSDLNRDGRLDLIVTQEGGGPVVIFLNQGNRTFAPAVTVAPDAIGFTAFDVDKDTDNDIVVIKSYKTGQGFSSRWAYDIVAMLNDGTGKFTSGPTASDVKADLGRSIVATDLTGSGSADLAIATYKGVATFLNDGHGYFSLAATYTLSSGSPSIVAAEDLDNDQRSDLVIFDSVSVAVLWGSSRGMFGQGPRYWTGAASDCHLADVDGDHRKEILVAGNVPKGNLNLFVFSPKDDTPGARFYSSTPIAGTTTIERLSELFAVDLDRDGRTDLLAKIDPFPKETVSVLLGSPTGLQSASLIPFKCPAVNAIAGDFDNNGWPDVLSLQLSRANKCIETALNHGPQGLGVSFSQEQPHALPDATSLEAPYALGDFDGNGTLDIAGTNALLMNRGSGSFQPGVSFDPGPGATGVVVGRFNGDDSLDLIVSRNTMSGGFLSLLPGDGKGGFGTPVQINADPNPAGVTPADIDLDGDPDLVVIHGTLIAIYRRDESGTFPPRDQYPVDMNPINSVAVGDINGDRFPDLVIEHITGFGVMLNNRDGTFQKMVSFGDILDLKGVGAYGAIHLGDFNGDHRIDVAIPLLYGILVYSNLSQ